VEIVRGEQSELLDTCLVRYTLENKDTVVHTAGLRFLLDTYIGANDGVPFTIPGDPELSDTMKSFETADKVPDFIQALEFEDLAHPGTVAHLKLKLGGRVETPSRVILGAWPDEYLHKLQPNLSKARGPDTLWDVPVLSMKVPWPYDSAVVIYWDPKDMQPGEKRELGFTYGLGNVSGSDRLLLTVDGSFKPGGELSVTALVKEPQEGEKLTLKLPQGFELKSGAAEQAVPAVAATASRRNSTVTWKVKAGPVGKHQLEAMSSKGAKQAVDVIIKASSIFD
jgi:hypothetical protein